jgi:hypothetical protein
MSTPATPVRQVRFGTIQGEVVLDNANHGILTLSHEPKANADGTGETHFIFRDGDGIRTASGTYNFTQKQDGELARLFARPGENPPLEFVVPVAQGIRSAVEKLVKAAAGG